MDDKQAIKEGFNKGYLIKKHRPTLAQALEKGMVEKDTPFGLGLLAGMKEADLEKTLSKAKGRKTRSWQITKPFKGKDKDLDKNI